MSNLTPTIIRLPDEKLRHYKELAAEAEMSLSEFVRQALESAARTVVFGEGAAVPRRKTKGVASFDLAKYKKWAAPKNRASLEHDKVLYR